MGGIVTYFTGSELDAMVNDEDMELFTAMNLTRGDVRLLSQQFRNLDTTNSGTIDVVELLAIIDVPRTAFTERIFHLFDSDNSGRINIREFIMSLWNYCTVGDASLDLFAFDLYDQIHHGILTSKDMKQLMIDMYGGANNMTHINKELAMIEKTKEFDIEAFQKFTRKYPYLLFPAFNLQSRLRTHIFGQRFWERASERRIELSHGTYLTMAELMRLHLNEGLYARLVEAHSWQTLQPMKSKAHTVLKATGTVHERVATEERSVGKYTLPPVRAPAHSPRDTPDIPLPRTVIGGKGVEHYFARPTSPEYNQRSSSQNLGNDQQKTSPRPSTSPRSKSGASTPRNHTSSPRNKTSPSSPRQTARASSPRNTASTSPRSRGSTSSPRNFGSTSSPRNFGSTSSPRNFGSTSSPRTSSRPSSPPRLHFEATSAVVRLHRDESATIDNGK